MDTLVAPLPGPGQGAPHLQVEIVADVLGVRLGRSAREVAEGGGDLLAFSTSMLALALVFALALAFAVVLAFAHVGELTFLAGQLLLETGHSVLQALDIGRRAGGVRVVLQVLQVVAHVIGGHEGGEGFVEGGPAGWGRRGWPCTPARNR